MGTWPGPSIITWQSCARARRPSSPITLQLGELGLVAGVGQRAGPQPVAQAPGHVVLVHDVAQFVEMGVERVLLAVDRHPLGHQRPAAADDARHPPLGTAAGARAAGRQWIVM